jgi:UDP-N-acetylglucosamine 2-epimerase
VIQKVSVIVGTRPEVIKMAPVIMELKRRPNFKCWLVSTGQHESMSWQAFEMFCLKPDEDLGVMRAGQELPGLMSILIETVTQSLRNARPDVVLVQGDTTTVLSTCFAAFYEKIPVGHVEAGLRTYDYSAPWPEEMNRRVTDAMSRWCFAPTKRAKDNLLREGIPNGNVFITGNTVIDALVWMKNRVMVAKPELPAGLERFMSGHRVILVTAHRRESFGEPFENICQAIVNVANEFRDVRIVYPVHLNPNVREPVERFLGKHSSIRLLEPLAYDALVWLMRRSHFVLTDSGGIQEEAPSLGKPVLVMRETTERPEGLESGANQLVGTDVGRISQGCATLLQDTCEYERRSQVRNPYGDGLASKRLVDILAGMQSEWRCMSERY